MSRKILETVRNDYDDTLVEQEVSPSRPKDVKAPSSDTEVWAEKKAPQTHTIVPNKSGIIDGDTGDIITPKVSADRTEETENTSSKREITAEIVEEIEEEVIATPQTPSGAIPTARTSIFAEEDLAKKSIGELSAEEKEKLKKSIETSNKNALEGLVWKEEEMSPNKWTPTFPNGHDR